jgi:hypothetical protein
MNHNILLYVNYYIILVLLSIYDFEFTYFLMTDI